MSKKAEHAVRDHRILTRAGERLGRCSLQRRNAVLRCPDSSVKCQVQRDVSERDLQLTSAGSLLHRGRSGAVLLTRTRCPIRPRPEEIHNPKQSFHLFFEDDVAAHPHDLLACFLFLLIRSSLDQSKRARTFFTRPTLRDSFHPPDPPIASQSITRDVRFAQASTAYINGPSKLACCLPGTTRMSFLLRLRWSFQVCY